MGHKMLEFPQGERQFCGSFEVLIIRGFCQSVAPSAKKTVPPDVLAPAPLFVILCVDSSLFFCKQGEKWFALLANFVCVLVLGSPSPIFLHAFLLHGLQMVEPAFSASNQNPLKPACYLQYRIKYM